MTNHTAASSLPGLRSLVEHWRKWRDGGNVLMQEADAAGRHQEAQMFKLVNDTIDVAIRELEECLASPGETTAEKQEGDQSRMDTLGSSTDSRTAPTVAPDATADARDDLGLSIDMLDVDRLGEWARLILVHGPDISHWGSPTFVASKMQTLAMRIEKAIRDIGTLRDHMHFAQVKAALSPTSAELREVLRELVRQWAANHYEHCGKLIPPWPHVGYCHWPLPVVVARFMTDQEVGEILDLSEP